MGELLEKQERYIEALDVYAASLKVNENQPRILE